MASVLVLDGAERFVETLPRFLASHGHHPVRVFTMLAPALDCLRSEPIDVVVLDVSADQPTDWDMLDSLRTAAQTTNPAARMICVSDKYRGAALRLVVEDRGARLVYV